MFALLSLSLLLFLRKELFAKLGREFFPDCNRHFKIFHPLDRDSRCLFMIDPETDRRCCRKISSPARDVAAVLRNAIFDSPRHPLLPYMLEHYSRLCHCSGSHQINNETNNRSVHILAKRWKKELMQVSFDANPAQRRYSSHDVLRQTSNAIGSDQSEPAIDLAEPGDRSSNPISDAAESELPSGFETYRPADNTDPLYLAIVRPLTRTDLEAGFIYIMKHPDYNDFVKIGYSSKLNNPVTRFHQWRARCDVNYGLHGRPFPVPFAKRIESIIHADLGNFGTSMKLVAAGRRTMSTSRLVLPGQNESSSTGLVG